MQTFVFNFPGGTICPPLSPATDLEVGTLAQDVLANVQVVLGRRRTLLASVGGGHAELPGLSEGLQVMGRHRPEGEVGLVSEQPAGQTRPRSGMDGN